MGGVRRAAALGLAVALVFLAAAPAWAAPRTEESPGSPLPALQGLAEHLSGLLDGWVRSVFAQSGVAGDPDGTPGCLGGSGGPAGSADGSTADGEIGNMLDPDG